MLGSRVREDYDKALEAEREGRTTIDEKGRKKRPTLTDAERDNIWVEVHSRVVREKIVFHIRKVRTQKSAGGGVLVAPTEDWIRIEKPITGDPDIDNRKNRGERVVTDLATGKVLERWNADGERVM